MPPRAFRNRGRCKWARLEAAKTSFPRRNTSRSNFAVIFLHLGEKRANEWLWGRYKLRRVFIRGGSWRAALYGAWAFEPWPIFAGWRQIGRWATRAPKKYGARGEKQGKWVVAGTGMYAWKGSHEGGTKDARAKINAPAAPNRPYVLFVPLPPPPWISQPCKAHPINPRRTNHNLRNRPLGALP